LGPDQNLVGLLSEGTPSDSNRAKPAIIIFNAGLIHRVGPHRIFYKLARLLAKNGFDVFRFDFSGIGDSDHRKDSLPFAQSVLQEVGMAMDFLIQARGKASFIVIGLCSGASASFQTAVEDHRVVGAILINVPTPGTPAGEELENASVYLRKSLFSARSWINFFFGQSNYRGVFNAFKGRIKNYLLRQSLAESESEEIVTFLRTAFHKFTSRKQHLLIISSGLDVGVDYLRQIVGTELKMFQDSGLLQLKNFPDADHTFTPLESQKRLFAAIQEWIQFIAPD
jgi:pimeloyl-ACP methyl ester carboxylesterase